MADIYRILTQKTMNRINEKQERIEECYGAVSIVLNSSQESYAGGGGLWSTYED
jgi:hypothetical protein